MLSADGDRHERCSIDTFAYILLPVLIVLNILSVTRDTRQYALFKTFEDSSQRQAMLQRWVLESFLLYGLSSIICLLLIGRLSAVIWMPDVFRDLSATIRQQMANTADAGFWSGMLHSMSILIVPALLVGPTCFTLLRTYKSHKNRITEKSHPMLEIRDVNALFPRNRRERFWTTLLSINAGISEELFFRLVAPLLIWLVSGSAYFAVFAATLWFGLGHCYQGWGGILITFFLGAIFMYIYLSTGHLWLVVLIHAVLDLNDLSFSPWFSEWLSAGSGDASDVGCG